MKIKSSEEYLLLGSLCVTGQWSVGGYILLASERNNILNKGVDVTGQQVRKSNYFYNNKLLSRICTRPAQILDKTMDR